MFVIHAVRADSVGYVTNREKRVTIVLPAGMTALADPAADVRDTRATPWCGRARCRAR